MSEEYHTVRNDGEAFLRELSSTYQYIGQMLLIDSHQKNPKGEVGEINIKVEK